MWLRTRVFKRQFKNKYMNSEVLPCLNTNSYAYVTFWCRSQEKENSVLLFRLWIKHQMNSFTQVPSVLNSPMFLSINSFSLTSEKVKRLSLDYALQSDLYRWYCKHRSKHKYFCLQQLDGTSYQYSIMSMPYTALTLMPPSILL